MCCARSKFAPNRSSAATCQKPWSRSYDMHLDRQTHRHTQRQKRRNTETQRHRDTETQRYRDTETQRRRHTATHTHTHTPVPHTNTAAPVFSSTSWPECGPLRDMLMPNLAPGCCAEESHRLQVHRRGLETQLLTSRCLLLILSAAPFCPFQHHRKMARCC